jgi:hypothetical protein
VAFYLHGLWRERRSPDLGTPFANKNLGFGGCSPQSTDPTKNGYRPQRFPRAAAWFPVCCYEGARIAGRFLARQLNYMKKMPYLMGFEPVIPAFTDR